MSVSSRTWHNKSLSTFKAWQDNVFSFLYLCPSRLLWILTMPIQVLEKLFSNLSFFSLWFVAGKLISSYCWGETLGPLGAWWLLNTKPRTNLIQKSLGWGSNLVFKAITLVRWYQLLGRNVRSPWEYDGL